MTFIEEWKDEEAIRLHNNTEHFKTIVPELAKLREGKPEINLYRTVFNK
jgi:quinol monooxygenase YgiN